MTFKTQAILDLVTFYNTDEDATDVLYKPGDDFEKTIPAIIDYGEGEEFPGADTLGQIATMRIQAQGADGIEQVAVGSSGDSLEIGEDVWKVMYAKKSADGLEWICLINKVEE